jgi:hypothetical protein
MKLEYRDLSSSRPEHQKCSRLYSFGFLDFFAASLLIFVVSLYLIMPRQIERVADLVVYEPATNSYASLRCIREKTTQYQFTQSRDVPELRSTVRVVDQAELRRYWKPQPDKGCYAAHGFTETVTRWEYFFGWLTRAVS